MGQDPLHLFPFLFSPFREIKTHKKLKIMNDNGTHLMIEPQLIFLSQIASSIYRTSPRIN